jgi:hypothetical protein
VDQIYERENARAMGILETAQILVRSIPDREVWDIRSVMTIYVPCYGVQRYVSMSPTAVGLCPGAVAEGRTTWRHGLRSNMPGQRSACAHWVRESLVKVLGKSSRELG